jgi:hypothetical protein
MRVINIDEYKSDEHFDIDKIQDVLKNVVAEAMKIVGIRQDEMKLILQFARENGGFSHKFHKGRNKKIEETDENPLQKFVLENVQKFGIAKNQDDIKSKVNQIKRFSKEIQNLAGNVGIYSGREDNLAKFEDGKQKLVGLRAAYVLDILGDQIDNLPSSDNSLKGLETKVQNNLKKLVQQNPSLS